MAVLSEPWREGIGFCPKARESLEFFVSGKEAEKSKRELHSANVAPSGEYNDNWQQRNRWNERKAYIPSAQVDAAA
jgi:hypothetical protein